jgi:hypothetical protein
MSIRQLLCDFLPFAPACRFARSGRRRPHSPPTNRRGPYPSCPMCSRLARRHEDYVTNGARSRRRFRSTRRSQRSTTPTTMCLRPASGHRSTRAHIGLRALKPALEVAGIQPIRWQHLREPSNRRWGEHRLRLTSTRPQLKPGHARHLRSPARPRGTGAADAGDARGRPGRRRSRRRREHAESTVSLRLARARALLPNRYGKSC